jgi:hypothetical protein
MKTIITVALVWVLASPNTVLAQGAEHTTSERADPVFARGSPAPVAIHHATMREAAKLATIPSAGGQAASSSKQNWTKRHPAALGTMVGFGAGFLGGASWCTSESNCDLPPALVGIAWGGIGAGIGAGVGALVGWLRSQ